jgi:hypothetical protein
MNTPPSTVRTSLLRVPDHGDASHFGTHRIRHLLREGCDLVTFDNLSARCHAPMRKGVYRLSGNSADRAAPAPRHPRAYNKHRDADDKVAYS